MTASRGTVFATLIRCHAGSWALVTEPTSSRLPLASKNSTISRVSSVLLVSQVRTMAENTDSIPPYSRTATS